MEEYVIVIFENARNMTSQVQRAVYKAGSGGEWVHCEIIDPQRNYLRASAWWKPGVIFKDIERLKKQNLDNYIGFIVPTTFTQEIHDFHISQIGKKYDKQGLFLNMYLDVRDDFKDTWFCSEINYYELEKIANLNLPNVSPERVTPMMLKLMLEKSGYKALPLAQLLSGTNTR